LLTLAVPLALVGFRVNSADALLAGGELSACEAWPGAGTAQGAVFAQAAPSAAQLAADDWAAAGRCELPAAMLPQRLAAATWLRLPAGTQLLYHPPGADRVVPLSANRTAPGSGECAAARDAAVSFNDAGAQQARSDIDRGRVGYYTVVLPASCGASSSYFANATVLVVGDYDACPFWSASGAANATSSGDSAGGGAQPSAAELAAAGRLHRRFASVLEQESAAAAQQRASAVSPALAAALAQWDGAGSGCRVASNALVTVSAGAPHAFYLRVASGFVPHWTASYYLARQPYDPADGGPWAARPRWVDTLDYRLNGIVALMADAAAFNAHANSASPVVPEQLASPFEGADWRDDGAAAFWTGAHPAGIRRLRDDFAAAFWGIVIFVCVAGGVALFMAVASAGWPRCIFTFGSIAVNVVVSAVPLPIVVITGLCFTNGAPNDSLELTQPVVCLAASAHDALGGLIYSSILLGLAGLGALLFLIWVCLYFALYDDPDD
jgi:hypothetical protein